MSPLAVTGNVQRACFWVLQNHGNLTLGYMHEIICHVLQSYLCDSKTGPDLAMRGFYRIGLTQNDEVLLMALQEDIT